MSYYCETCGMPKHACRGCPDESSEAGSRAATCSAFEAWWEDYVGGAKIEAAAMKAWTEWKASTEGDGILFSLRQHIITADQAGSNEVLVKAFAAGFLAASRTVARTQSDSRVGQTEEGVRVRLMLGKWREEAADQRTEAEIFCKPGTPECAEEYALAAVKEELADDLESALSPEPLTKSKVNA